MSYERTISELAAKHGGHITRSQLVELGLSDPMISRRVSAGFLTRVKFGVYRTFTPPDEDALLRGAVLSLRSAVVSHMSAARIHGLVVPTGRRPVVTVPAST
ncbi:MAG: type IV toxin-antitoxin system AbiEi family antitoxin domain-containing protein, partial [Acidimicrobiia bacterium]|nr:type IV toxin-antitoxin system AbiEi family antitoxin domain-containing protein [Acidimicrobiia bacterium]